MNQNNVKSATTAGLLGIFLGSVGAHSWYLGQKKQGIIHVCLFSGGLLLELIGAVLIPIMFLNSLGGLMMGLTVAPIIAGLGGLVLLGNAIWALVEAIIILSKGDAGLAAQGYATTNAFPTAPAGGAANNAAADNTGAGAANGAMATGDAAGVATTTAAAPATADGSNATVAAPVAGQPGVATPVQPAQKKPMDPAKKKKIILFSCIGGGVLVLGIALAIILPMILRVDYGEAYRVAGELQEQIDEIYYDYACQNVEDYVDSSYTSDKTYEEYVTECKDVGGTAKELLDKLGNTDGVKRNKDIKAKYDSFKTLFDQVVTSGESKEETLRLFTVWHQWIVASDELDSWDETDADLTAAASILINSGNEKLKTYGEGWLERRKTAAAAQRAYDAASYLDDNKSELRVALDNARDDYNTWQSENEPSISELGSVITDDTSELESEYEKLYELIASTYEQNYNHGSGDCWEVGEVICD